MIFSSPASAQTAIVDKDGAPLLFWRNWLRDVAAWLIEASRVTVSGDLQWSQQGQVVFLNWKGGAGTAAVGRGGLPPIEFDTLLTQADGSTAAITAGQTELSFTQPATGWYFSRGAA